MEVKNIFIFMVLVIVEGAIGSVGIEYIVNSSDPLTYKSIFILLIALFLVIDAILAISGKVSL